MCCPFVLQHLELWEDLQLVTEQRRNMGFKRYLCHLQTEARSNRFQLKAIQVF